MGRTRAKRTRPTVPSGLRWEVWERDDFTCRHCGARRYLAIDHITPVSAGGETDSDNLQTLCRSCNRRKGGVQRASARPIRLPPIPPRVVRPVDPPAVIGAHGRPKCVQQNLSLRAIDVHALAFLVEADGAESVSAVVRRLIDDRMTRDYGPDWESVVDKDAERQDGKAA